MKNGSSLKPFFLGGFFWKSLDSPVERVWVCFSAGKKMSERSELFFPEEKHTHGLSAPKACRLETEQPTPDHRQQT